MSYEGIKLLIANAIQLRNCSGHSMLESGLIELSSLAYKNSINRIECLCCKWRIKVCCKEKTKIHFLAWPVKCTQQSDGKCETCYFYFRKVFRTTMPILKS